LSERGLRAGERDFDLFRELYYGRGSDERFQRRLSVSQQGNRDLSDGLCRAFAGIVKTLVARPRQQNLHSTRGQTVAHVKPNSFAAGVVAVGRKSKVRPKVPELHRPFDVGK